MFEKRREAVLKHMKDGSVLILYSGTAPRRTRDLFYPFYVDRHFYYLTGIDEEDCVLVMYKGNGMEKQTLFIPSYDEVKALWDGGMLSEEVAKERSGIPLVLPRDLLERKFALAMRYTGAEDLYINVVPNSISNGLTWQQEMAGRIRKRFIDVVVHDADGLLKEFRIVKDKGETDNLRKAIDLTREAFERVMKSLKPGMNEADVENEFCYASHKDGGRDSFSIIASGGNTTVMHYMKNDKPVADGDLVLMDCGVEYGKYHSDITRTVPANGRFSERQKLVYSIVLETQKYLIGQAKPGVRFGDLTKMMYEKLTELSAGAGLLDSPENIKKLCPHPVGHSLGLDPHDPSGKDFELREGAVITIEPGLYLSEESLGVRIEDDVLITEEGCEVLSKDIIKQIDEIEALMR